MAILNDLKTVRARGGDWQVTVTAVSVNVMVESVLVATDPPLWWGSSGSQLHPLAAPNMKKLQEAERALSLRQDGCAKCGKVVIRQRWARIPVWVADFLPPWCRRRAARACAGARAGASARPDPLAAAAVTKPRAAESNKCVNPRSQPARCKADCALILPDLQSRVPCSFA